MEEVSFSGQVWLYEGEGSGAWHFVTLPQTVSTAIQSASAGTKKAFGSVKVSVLLGDTRWKTSLFPSKKLAAYVLPLKAAVLRKEQLQPGMTVEVCVFVG